MEDVKLSPKNTVFVVFPLFNLASPENKLILIFNNKLSMLAQTKGRVKTLEAFLPLNLKLVKFSVILI